MELVQSQFSRVIPLTPVFLQRFPCSAHLSCLSLHTATITSRLPRMAIRITTERNVSSTTFSTDPKPSLELEDMWKQNTEMWGSLQDTGKKNSASVQSPGSSLHHQSAVVTVKLAKVLLGFPGWPENMCRGLRRGISSLDCVVLFCFVLPFRESPCIILRYSLGRFVWHTCLIYSAGTITQGPRLFYSLVCVQCIILAYQMEEMTVDQWMIGTETKGCMNARATLFWVSVWLE